MNNLANNHETNMSISSKLEVWTTQAMWRAGWWNTKGITLKQKSLQGDMVIALTYLKWFS